MSSEANKFKLGLFVLFAIVILFGGLFLLGGQQLFRSSVPAVTVFNESVQGLEIGSQVKMRGVPIGRVSEILLRPRDALIQVEMELNLEGSGLSDVSSFRKYMGQQVEDGLGCRLQFTSITGDKYIEIEYLKEKAILFDVAKTSLPDNAIYIPSGPSLLASVTESATETLSNLAQVDFEGISNKLNASLIALNETIDSERFERTADNIDHITSRLRTISQRFDEHLDPGSISSTLKDFRDTSAKARELIAETEAQITDANLAATTAALRETLEDVREQLAAANIEATANDFRETLASTRTAIAEVEGTAERFRGVAANADKTLAEMQLPATTETAREAFAESATALQDLASLQRDVRLSLRKLNTTLDQLSEFVRYLDEDPAALLRGKRKPEAE